MAKANLEIKIIKMLEKTTKYLTVCIGDKWCGIEVSKIIEVLHFMAFDDVPTLRNDILGFITVRNEVMPLIDMRRRFGITNAVFKMDTPIVALRETCGSVALIFDSANQVEAIQSAQITPLQDATQFPDIYGVVKLANQLILLLETNRISKEIHSVGTIQA